MEKVRRGRRPFEYNSATSVNLICTLSRLHGSSSIGADEQNKLRSPYGCAGGARRPRRGQVRQRHRTDSKQTTALIYCSRSQVALSYVHSIRDVVLQTFVFWVYASTQARFEEAYRDIADQLELL
jgi:hypothetical protein